MEVLERLVRDGKIAVYEVVQHTSLDRLNDVVTMLLRHQSSTAVCTALRDRIARSPLDQFNELKLSTFMLASRKLRKPSSSAAAALRHVRPLGVN